MGPPPEEETMKNVPHTLILAALGAAALMPSAEAADVLTVHRVSAPLANQAVMAAVDACSRQGFSVSAVFLDTDGIQQAVLRGDGAGIHTMEVANDKAFTAVSYKLDTITQVERAKGIPSRIMAKEPHLLLNQGGIVVKIGDEVVGSIGVSGGPGMQYDTDCARAGLAAIAGRLK
jgi:uncharacterized protein GlcG (DUF336 family)